MIQADAKEHLMAITREYDRARAVAYLHYSESEKAHFKVANQVNADPRVLDLRSRLDEADMDHYRKWIETSHLVSQLAAIRQLPFEPADETPPARLGCP